MPKQTVADVDIAGKRVLLRADLNVTFIPNTNVISDDSRIKAVMPTIDYLKSKGAKIILCSHLGRPKGRVVEELRLTPVANRLKELITDGFSYVSDVIGPAVESEVDEMREGDVLLLENLRFYPGEESNDAEFAKGLSRFADVYVNDAFGAAHRAHASVHAITELLPAVAGFQMSQEIEMLGSTVDNPQRPLLAVMGGAKVSDKILVLQKLIDRIDRLIIGGGMAATFLKALGHEMGKSAIEEDRFDLVKSALSKANDMGVNVVLPVDFVVARSFCEEAEPVIVKFDEVPADGFIMDIGPSTIEEFKMSILGSKTVIWNGPMGVFEWTSFSKGTSAVALAIAGLKSATTVVGGGSTAEAVETFGVSDRMSHVSIGGGASLEFMEGKELPAVAVLPDREN
ncbi:MAG: phosphoglycerate kinase [Chloroflexi bacterium]|nr:MAG: phosphoglycerate kinase [Chloroflexota bacterium]